MTKFIGRTIGIGIAREVTRGTYRFPDFWLPYTVLFFDDNIEVSNIGQRYEDIRGGGNFPYTQSSKASGTISGELDADIFGILLVPLFGNPSSSGPVDSAYTHTFTQAQSNSNDSLSITETSAVGIKRFINSMLSRLEIIVNPGEIVQYQADFLSRRAKIK